MLGKLIKYEWKNLSRKFLIMLAILVVTTLVSSLMIISINFDFDQVNDYYSAFMMMGSILIYYLGGIICSLGTSLIIAIRFYKSCYTDAGYLTHTLPVSAHQLVGAKTFTACLVQFLSLICIFLSSGVYIAVMLTAILNSSASFTFGELSMTLIITDFEQELGMSVVQYVIFLLVYSIIGCITGVCILLGCVSLGQLYTKHRVLGAIIAYFAVTMIMQIVSGLALIPTYGKMLVASTTGETFSMMDILMPVFIFVLIINIAVAIAMYFINIHMMTKKLNLE